MNHILVISIIVLILLFFDGMATFIPVICRNNKEIPDDPTLTTPDERKWFKENAEEVEAKSEDGLKLIGYQFKQKKKSDVWVILIHGHRINAMTAMSPKFFYDKGWNVFCPDLRAHGKSEGKYIGMGWKDRKDLLMWIKRIIDENKSPKIVLVGGSMGGAAVMMTAGEKLPSEVKCGISDSGFTSVWDLAAFIIKDKFHLPAFPTLHLASILSKIICGFSFKEASSINQLQKSTLPMLFIHGTLDEAVPFKMLDQVYDAAKGEKEKLVVEGAAHVGSYRLVPELYWDRVFKFIEKHL